MQIAVHIVTYNSAATIGICLQALRQQTVPFQLCIIDNASSDNTIALIEALGYRVHRNPHNRGYGAAHNQALQQTDAPIVVTLNPDVQLLPAFLEQVITAFAQQDRLGAVNGLLLRCNALPGDGDQIDSAGLYLTRTLRQRLRHEGQVVHTLDLQPAPIFGPDGAAAVYRRAMLDDIAIEGAVFDDNFFLHKEDVDICWRAQKRGWEALFLPQARAYHIRHFRAGQRLNVSAQLRYYGVRNRYLLLVKNASWQVLLRRLPFILAYDLAIFVYLVLFERASLRIYRDVWQMRRILLQQRAKIRASTTHPINLD